MDKCDYFKIYELVDPKTYEAYGQRAWQFLDSRLLYVIDELRDVFGPATINDWKWGGSYQWSGLRTENAFYMKKINGKLKKIPIGAPRSQHRFGRAADMKFKNISAPDVRKAIKDDQRYWEARGIMCIENKTPTWLHVDVRNCNPIKWINP